MKQGLDTVGAQACPWCTVQVVVSTAGRTDRGVSAYRQVGRSVAHLAGHVVPAVRAQLPARRPAPAFPCSLPFLQRSHAAASNHPRPFPLVQTVSFYTWDQAATHQAVLAALNSNCPPELRAWHAERVPRAFHATFQVRLAARPPSAAACLPVAVAAPPVCLGCSPCEDLFLHWQWAAANSPRVPPLTMPRCAATGALAALPVPLPSGPR